MRPLARGSIGRSGDMKSGPAGHRPAARTSPSLSAGSAPPCRIGQAALPLIPASRTHPLTNQIRAILIIIIMHKLKLLRSILESKGLYGYLEKKGDGHLSEYLT
jgi:hypothetical protein